MKTRKANLDGQSAKIPMAIAAAVSFALAGTAAAQQKPSPGLEEVIVTATKRDESVLNVPYNISAITSQQIENSGIQDLEGITRVVPGLAAPDLGPRANSSDNFLVIRGINSTSVGGLAPRLQQSLVSTYVDETPIFVNLKLIDIDRVEVLRGPQGTLYGSSSVGGTVRLIFNQPSTKGCEGKFSAKVSSTAHSGEPSYDFDAIGNIPLGDTLALRMSAGYEYVSGFIDANSAVTFDRPLTLTSGAQPVLANPSDPLGSGLTFHTLKDIDTAKTWFARAALRWSPSERVDVTGTYHHQYEYSGGFSSETPGSDYVVSKYIPQEPLTRDIDLYSLTLTGNFGFATLTSSSSYYTNDYHDLWDLTFLGEKIANSVYYGFYPRPTQTNFDFSSEHTFAQEVRLVSNNKDGHWDWVVGAFYRDSKTSLSDPETMPGLAAWSQLPGSAAANNAALGTTFANFGDFIQYYSVGVRPSQLSPPDFIYNFERSLHFRDIATFGELTFRPTKAWQVTAGARVFSQDYSQHITQEIPLCGVFCSQNFDPKTFTGDPYGRSSGDASNSTHSEVFKANTSLHVTDTALLYFTWSQGFRPGGANAFAIGACPYCEPNADLVPYAPDKATNNELGIKGRYGTSVQYSAAIYRIDWNDIQIEKSDQFTGTTIIVNGGKARSQGAELELDVQPVERLTAMFGFSVVNAELTQDFVVQKFTGKKGDRLPSVPGAQASAALDWVQPVSGSNHLRFHIDGSYRGSVYAGLNGTQKFSPFTVVNGSITLNFTDSWDLRAFVENLTSVKGVTDEKGTGFAPHNVQEFVIRPRTIGIGVTYKML